MTMKSAWYLVTFRGSRSYRVNARIPEEAAAKARKFDEDAFGIKHKTAVNYSVEKLVRENREVTYEKFSGRKQHQNRDSVVSSIRCLINYYQTK